MGSKANKTKRTARISHRSLAIKKAKREAKVRKQILPSESLLDVFNCVDRHSLDGFNVVSGQYANLVQRADPLHTVDGVQFKYHKDTKVFKVVFVYKTMPPKRRPNTTKKAKRIVELQLETKDFKEAVNFFAGAIWRSNVTGETCLAGFEVDQYFADMMKEVAGSFRVNDKKTLFVNVESAVGLNAVEFLATFSLRQLNNTLAPFIKWTRMNYVDDGILKSLAENRIWCIGPSCTGTELSYEGILDFSFGAYDSEDHVRSFIAFDVILPTNFLKLLIQARRESTTDHKTRMLLQRRPTLGPLDMEEFRENATLVKQHGSAKHWRFTFEDIPNFVISYYADADAVVGSMVAWSSNVQESSGV